MNLKSLSTPTLLSQTKAVVAEERRISTDVLWHLFEVERRRAYAETKYDSLFAYCTGELKYSNGSASRRINAMRLLKEYPEIESSIRDGSLPVSTASDVQVVARKAAFDLEEKKELIEAVTNKPQREIEKIFYEIAPELSRNSQIEVSPELLEELRRIQALTGHVNHSLEDTLKWMAALCLKKLETKTGKAGVAKTSDARSLKTLETDVTPESTFSPVPDESVQQKSDNGADSSKRSVHTDLGKRYIPAELKRAVWTRDQGRCRYVDSKGERCISTYALEIDHIVSYAKGGLTVLRNLRLLCRAHNQRHAIREFGLKKMSRYLRSSRMSRYLR